MTISTTQLNESELNRKLLLVSRCPVGFHFILKNPLSNFVNEVVIKNGGKLTPELFSQIVNKFTSFSFTVELFSRLSATLITLTKDGQNIVCDFDIPWGVKNGLVIYSNKTNEVLWSHYLVGDLSEGLLQCSYNEDVIREHWNNNTLNTLLQENMNSLNRVNYKSWMPKDKDIQGLLTFLLKQRPVWPVDYSQHSFTANSNLTDKERKIIEAFDDVAYIQNQYKTAKF